jgi:predicted RNA methylase
MSDGPAIIWSNTDYPYICLIDKKRTLAFKKAIEERVKPGDTVVEVGAGTGILSLFAAVAGAARVYAVEIDPVLAESLRETVRLNHQEDKIEVIEGDALTVELPDNVDVIIGELIDTGLLDEMQVAVMNGLHGRSVIGPNTQLIPQAYETFLELVDTDNKFYGFQIASHKHDWPYYSEDPASWEQLEVKPVADKQSLGYFDFRAGPVEPKVDKVLQFKVADGERATAIRLSGTVHLTDTIKLGPTNSLNGDKILPLKEYYQGSANLAVEYVMGAGLHDLKAKSID